ncbi:MAG TPA: DUF2067 domain-containing protein [Ignisphaera sp.]|nr:DUF2067 domain-containing protein [Ignisphaera sp.]
MAVDNMPKRGYVEKLLQIYCSSQEFCIDLIEKIDEELSSHATVIAQMKGNKVLFRIIGFEPDVQRTLIQLKQLINLIQSKQRLKPSKGVSAAELAKLARRSVPLDVLAKVLQIRGIPAKAKTNIIYADTDLDTLIQAAQSLGEALDEVSSIPLGYSLKKFVIGAIALTGLKPAMVLRKAEELGLINEKGELVEDWDKALEKFIEFLGEESEDLEEF